MKNNTLTAIPGIRVGHVTDTENHTGCTAVLCPEGFTPGVTVPGFAPGSRETDLLRAESTVDVIHGVLLAGGSAFGLAAADGIVRYLREGGFGLVMEQLVIPLVPGAVIYDLDRNKKAGILPDSAMGYHAAQQANNAPVLQGLVGAGTGARCGRLFSSLPKQGNHDHTSPGGLGSAAFERQGLQVAALVVVNALGNVHDPDTGAWLAGGVDAKDSPLNKERMYTALSGSEISTTNTVLTVVATNACLNKQETNRLARMAAAGLPRSIRPAHLPYDGDIVFALSSKNACKPNQYPESLIGALAAESVAHAAANAIRARGA